MDSAGIEICRERDGLGIDVDPFFEMIQEHETVTRWLACYQQQCMIAAGVGAGDRTGGKSSPAVRLEPFQG